MRAVDTNVLVRLLTGDGAQQVAAAEDYVAGGAWISQVVLVETIWVLDSVYSVPRPGLIAAIQKLLDHETLVLHEPDVIEAALQDFRSRTKLGFTDCIVLAIAKRHGHFPLGTFDRELAKLDATERI